MGVAMGMRPCLRCKRLTSNPSRCNRCDADYQAVRNAQRGSAHQRGYTSRYRSLARTVVAEHVRLHGHACPGWQVPAHESSDLTVDHIIPLARGGTHDRSNMRVLCRGCNSRKRDAQ